MFETSHWYRRNSPKPPVRYLDLRSAIRGLASIHDGIKGQSIPNEVMRFYKVLKNRDAFRPRMLREVVLGLEDALKDGALDRWDLREIVLRRLASFVCKLPIGHLEDWLQADFRRSNKLPAASNNRRDRLRVGWLSEAEEMIDDTLMYAECLVVCRP